MRIMAKDKVKEEDKVWEAYKKQNRNPVKIAFKEGLMKKKK